MCNFSALLGNYGRPTDQPRDIRGHREVNLPITLPTAHIFIVLQQFGCGGGKHRQPQRDPHRSVLRRR